MKRLYYMSYKETPSTACAIAPKGSPIFICNMAEELEVTGRLPFTLTLMDIIFKNGKRYISDDLTGLKTIWTDCLLNSALLFLCSENLRDVIDNNMKGYNYIKWITCDVVGQEECRQYFFPLFTERLDLLDKGGDWDKRKTAKFPLITLPEWFNWRISNSFYVSEEMRKAIKKSGATKGLSLNPTGIYIPD